MLCQVPHSVSQCQCEVVDLRRGLCNGGISIFGNGVHLGMESEFSSCWRCVHESHSICKTTCVHVWDSLMATCGSVLVGLWVWGESI